MLITILVSLILTLASNQESTPITNEQKQQFLARLETLPTRGEFYTDEAVREALVYLPVLFALTEADIQEYDIYPFLALSRGLFEHRQVRNYSVRNFGKILHAELKLFWGAMIFDSKEASPEIKRFLRRALKSKSQAAILSEMLGPKFQSFKKRVLAN